jgi:hypothetical protein
MRKVRRFLNRVRMFDSCRGHLLDGLRAPRFWTAPKGESGNREPIPHQELPLLYSIRCMRPSTGHLPAVLRELSQDRSPFPLNESRAGACVGRFVHASRVSPSEAGLNAVTKGCLYPRLVLERQYSRLELPVALGRSLPRRGTQAVARS